MTVATKTRRDLYVEAEERRQGLTTVNTIGWLRYTSAWGEDEIESPPYGGRYTHPEDKDQKS
jgi:hypothetical protein